MNEKQRDGMERAGETGEIIDRRAGERRTAAPVVAVVAAKLPDVNNVCAVERPSDMGITIKFMSTRAASQFEREFSQMWVASLGLASQAQAAVSAPALVNIEHLSRYDLVFNDGEACIEECAGGDYVHFDDVEKLLAAQAAVGVASQQEQQPQPSCNAALRAAPEGQPDASNAVLTTDEIIAIVRQAYKDERLTWVGFTKDERGHYTVPVLSQIHFDLARVIEAELACRFRAQGGNTNDKASPDLASIASQAHPTDEQLREAIATGLRGLYGCSRVWSAWGVGTMSEDDFYPADEDDDCVGQVLDAINSLKSTPTES